MNYYKRHLGDYARDCGHLTLMEHGAYTLLLDRYYASESPIQTDDAYRICHARTPAEKLAVDAILREFFVKGDAGYQQKRADIEIEAKRRQTETNRETGLKGGRPKKQTEEQPKRNRIGLISDSEKNPSHKPVASSQKTTPKPPSGAWPGFEDFYLAYPKHQGRAAALKAWEKLRPDELLRARIARAVAAASGTPGWKKDGGAFIPMPATWLNGKRWEDQIQPPGADEPVLRSGEIY